MMKKEDEFNYILDICIDALKSKQATIPELLARYPKYADHLSPYLKEINTLLEFKSGVLSQEPYQPPSAKTIIQRLPPREKQQGISISNYFKRIPVYLASVFLIITIITFGVYTEINNAIPGDALYKAKLNLEKAQLEFTHDSYRKSYLSLKFANRRLDEINALIAEGKTDLVADTSYQYSNLLLDAINYLSVAETEEPTLSPSMETLIADQTASLIENTTQLLASSDSPTTTLELSQDIVVMQTFYNEITRNNPSSVPTISMAFIQPTLHETGAGILSAATESNVIIGSPTPIEMVYTPTPTNTTTSTQPPTQTETEVKKTPKPTRTKRPTNTPRPTNTHHPTSKPTKTPKFTPKPSKTPKP